MVLPCYLHEDDVEAEETISFAANGINYEMEFCADHSAHFSEVIEAWTQVARLVASAAGGLRRSGWTLAGQANESGEGVDLAEVREWARAIGHEVSNRGRIAEPVLDAFLGAKGQPG